MAEQSEDKASTTPQEEKLTEEAKPQKSLMSALEEELFLAKEIGGMIRYVKNPANKETIKKNVILFCFVALISLAINMYAKLTEVPRLNIFGDISDIEVYLGDRKLDLPKVQKGSHSLAKVWIDIGHHVLKIKKGKKELLRTEQDFSIEKLYFVYIGKEWLKIDWRNCRYRGIESPKDFYDGEIKINVDGNKSVFYFTSEDGITENDVEAVLGFTFEICTKPSLTSFSKNAALVYPDEEIPVIYSDDYSEGKKIVLSYMTRQEQLFCSKIIQKGEVRGNK